MNFDLLLSEDESINLTEFPEWVKTKKMADSPQILNEMFAEFETREKSLLHIMSNINTFQGESLIFLIK